MKKLYSALILIIVLHFALTGVLISFLPDIVPMHYNALGEVDRMGSKYEMFIFPAFTLVMGAAMALLARKAVKDALSEKVLLVVGVCSELLFVALSVFLFIVTYRYDPAASAAVVPDVSRFTCIAMGVTFVILGNIMPKARRNSAFGLRTVWSMHSDNVWQKSQRFAGIVGVICGFVLVVLGALLPGMYALLALLLLSLSWAIIASAASYRYYKQEISQ